MIEMDKSKILQHSPPTVFTAQATEKNSAWRLTTSKLSVCFTRTWLVMIFEVTREEDNETRP